MDSIEEINLGIFQEFFKKRPEISKEDLEKDLKEYYLPFVKKLIDLKKAKNSSGGLIVGVSAIQGAGKTTQGEILEILLKHFSYSSVSLSIDDHYITHKQLCALREADPRFIRRGVTHDISLAIKDLENLKTMEDGKPILISGYDKGANNGDGDRFSWVNLTEGLVINGEVIEENTVVDKKLQEIKVLKLTSLNYHGQPLPLPVGSNIPLVENLLSEKLLNFLNNQTDEIIISLESEDEIKLSGKKNLIVSKKEFPNAYKLVTKKPDFIFYDGWMLGARSVKNESVFNSGLPALETEQARNFAKDVNKKLIDYEPLWALIEFMNVLYVKNYQDSLKWRDQAEDSLRAKGEGMTHEEIKEFVYYFWRSVHPAIHIKNLAEDGNHTDQVVIINDDHSVGGILSPSEVKTKYP